MKTHIFLVLTGVLLASFLNAQNYSFVFKPQKNDAYDVYTRMKSTIIQQVLGEEITVEMVLNMNSLYEFDDDGANKKISITYNKMDVDMGVMGMSTTMSSESDAPESAVLRQLKGKTVSLTVTPQGNIVNVWGAEKLLDTAGADASQIQAIMSVVGSDAVKSSMTLAMDFYPEQPIKVGQSWSKTTTLTHPYELVAESSYTLQRVEGKKAFINVVSKLNTPSDVKMEYQGMTMGIHLEGGITGSYEVDLDSGLSVAATTQQNMKGEIEAMGQKLPMIVSTNTNTTYTKH